MALRIVDLYITRSRHMYSGVGRGRGFIVAMLTLWILLWPSSSTLAQSMHPKRTPFLGIQMENSPSGLVLVTAVLPGSAADHAGFLPGDLMRRVAGTVVHNPREVTALVSSIAIGDRISVEVMRSGQSRMLSAVLGYRPSSEQVGQALIGKNAPSLSLPSIVGSKQIDISRSNGRVRLLYFWSVWCGACRLAMPSINRWHRSFAMQGLSVVAVTNDPIPEVRQLLQQTGVSYPVVHDSGGKVGAAYWVSAVPSFFVIDRSGLVTYAVQGWDANQARAIEALLQRLLSQRRP